MASTWSDNLKIELLGTGDTNWGNLTNNNFKWAIEESITGYGTATFPSDADYDWGAGYTNSNSSQAQRNLVIRVTGTISTTRNLIVPLNSAGTAPIEKQYIFWNDTTGGQAIVVKTPSGTGVTIPNGVRMHVYVDGTNVVQMDNYDVSRTIGTLSLTNALTVANGGTGITAFGTGVATALGQNVTGSGGIVLATSPTLSAPNLGTPSAVVLTNATGLPLTTGVTGTLPVANGGTGITSFGTGVATALGQNVTGSGGIVLATSPTLFTPNLGTPSAATLTNATGLPIDGGTTGTLPASRGGTGVTSLGTGVATALGQNVTGSGGIVLATSPTLSTPNLGTPSAATLTNATGLPLTTGVTGTLPVANGGTGVTSSTGTGSVVLSNSPALTTPNLGTPSAATLTNATGLPIDGGTTGTLPVNRGGTGASDAGTARTNLGLGSIATQAANNVSITGGSISGITDLAVADGGTGASDAGTARTNLDVPSRSGSGASGTWGISISGNAATASTASDGAGISQSWQSVSRSGSTNYQNTTSRPIMVAVNGTGNYTRLYVGVSTGSLVEIAYNNASGSGPYEQYHISAIVPINHYYQITGNFSGVAELR